MPARQTRKELDRRAATLDGPLRQDYNLLATVERESATSEGYNVATRVRRDLACDTMAPSWLRRYAEEIIEDMRAQYPR